MDRVTDEDLHELLSECFPTAETVREVPRRRWPDWAGRLLRRVRNVSAIRAVKADGVFRLLFVLQRNEPSAERIVLVDARRRVSVVVDGWGDASGTLSLPPNEVPTSELPEFLGGDAR